MKWKTIALVTGLVMATLGSVAVASPVGADSAPRPNEGSDSSVTRQMEHGDMDMEFMADHPGMNRADMQASHDGMLSMMEAHDSSGADHAECPGEETAMRGMMAGMSRSSGSMMTAGMGGSNGTMMSTP